MNDGVVVDPRLVRHVRAVLRRWWVVALAGVVGAALLYVWTGSQPVTYRSTSTFQIVVSVVDDGRASDFRAAALAELVDTGDFREEVAEQADLDAEDVADRVSATQRVTPGFIELSASGDDPEAAQALAEVATDVLEGLAETPSDEELGVSTRVVTRPELPTAPATGEASLPAAVFGFLLFASAAVGAVLVASIVHVPATGAGPRDLGRYDDDEDEDEDDEHDEVESGVAARPARPAVAAVTAAPDLVDVRTPAPAAPRAAATRNGRATTAKPKATAARAARGEGSDAPADDPTRAELLARGAELRARLGPVARARTTTTGETGERGEDRPAAG